MDCDSLLSLWAMQPCCEPDGMSTGHSPIKPCPAQPREWWQTASQKTAAGCLEKSGSRLPQSMDFVGKLAFNFGDVR